MLKTGLGFSLASLQIDKARQPDFQLLYNYFKWLDAGENQIKETQLSNVELGLVMSLENLTDLGKKDSLPFNVFTPLVHTILFAGNLGLIFAV